jgi:simple sugar transport system ATP-binding protein
VTAGTARADVTPPRLALRNVSKRFPAVLANDDVSLDVRAGEIHAVLGENGAGKSTLMKIIAGAQPPDTGTLEVDGKPAAIRSPNDARALGIAMVYQHFALFDTLTVAENIALGLPAGTATTTIAGQVRDLGARYGLDLDPAARVHELSMGERQRIEILRSLLASPRLLILDEPTSVLTPQAVDKLFATLRQLAGEGVSILFISHKLDEIRRLADRCTVLRAGRVVTSVNPAGETEQSLARLMIGADPPQIARHETPPRAPLLQAVDLLPAAHQASRAALLSFTLHAGEILGVAGISGNGQHALVSALAGEVPSAAESLLLDGRPIGRLGPLERRRLGVRYVPEERLRHGAVPELSLAENTLLTGERLRRRGFVQPRAMRAFALSVIERYGVRCGGPGARASSLSGGNLQKFIVGREIDNAPRVLIVNQPTWGVDVGASAAIRNALLALRAQGVGVLVVSEEVDELFEICDRIMVIAQGRLSPAVPARELSLDELGRWMSGLWPGAQPQGAEAAGARA